MDTTKLFFIYACRLLGRRAYTAHQIEQKLMMKAKKLGIQDADGSIESVLRQLKDLKYINDEYFAEAFVRTQIARKPQGARKIKLLLQQKGVSNQLAESALQSQMPDEYELAKNALEKRFNKLKSSFKSGKDLAKIKQKLYQHLSAQGFQHGVIMSLINAVKFGESVE